MKKIFSTIPAVIGAETSAEKFVQYAISIGALELLPNGRELKSGRISPYFFNSGLFCSGESLSAIADAYAQKISNMMKSGGLVCDVLFGPAYKGIPLVAVIAMRLAEHYGINLEWSANRKEAKKYGEGGIIIGASLAGKRILIIDDVITDGASKREAVEIIRTQGGIPIACMVGFDRQEKGYDLILKVDKGISAAQEFEQTYDIPLIAAAYCDDLISLLQCTPAESGDDQVGEILEKILVYREQYGVGLQRMRVSDAAGFTGGVFFLFRFNEKPYFRLYFPRFFHTLTLRYFLIIFIMKHKKSIPVQKNTSFDMWLKILIGGLVILVLFLIFYKKDTTQKIGPDTHQASVCSSESYPVCGKDGKTYTNSCTAEKIANVRVAYVGACREEGSESTEEITQTETGAEVDSGIENIGPVPKYTTDREDTATGEISPGDTTESLISGATESASGEVDPTLVTYMNSTYHYGFSMPKNSYYQAFGAQNGANHSVGISTGTGTESLSDSDVRVYFYANKIIGKLAEAANGSYTDPATGTIYLLLNDKDSVMIESSNLNNKVVQTIVQTIHKE